MYSFHLTSSIFLTQVRKAPQVSQSNGESDGRQNVFGLTPPTVTDGFGCAGRLRVGFILIQFTSSFVNVFN